MSDERPCQHYIEKLKGEVAQIGDNCTVNIYHITNHNYYNQLPPEDLQGHGQSQPTITVQEEVKVEVINSKDGSLEPSSPVTTMDRFGRAVDLELGDTLDIVGKRGPALSFLYTLCKPSAMYTGDGMVVSLRHGIVMKERLEDVKLFSKRTLKFAPNVRLFTKSKAVKRAMEKVGDVFQSECDFFSWCYTGLIAREACGCLRCMLLDARAFRTLDCPQ